MTRGDFNNQINKQIPHCVRDDSKGDVELALHKDAVILTNHLQRHFPSCTLVIPNAVRDLSNIYEMASYD
jgi:hypothetical protein